MPRKPPYIDTRLTRRAFTFGVPVAALATPPGDATASATIDALWDRWQALRAAMDAPAGAGDDAHVGIEERLYRVAAEMIDAPASDQRAVIIKLSMLLGMAPIECGQDDEFPWPQIRSVIRGLQTRESDAAS